MHKDVNFLLKKKKSVSTVRRLWVFSQKIFFRFNRIHLFWLVTGGF